MRLWPPFSYNQFRPADAVIEIQKAEASERARFLVQGGANTLYISPVSVGARVCPSAEVSAGEGGVHYVPLLYIKRLGYYLSHVC